MHLELQEKHEHQQKKAHEEQMKLKDGVEMAQKLMEDTVKTHEEIQRENKDLRKTTHDQAGFATIKGA
ncbi:hypothetical protein VNO80_02944 [Phaseolus coccineus]|uniref:Uncharacterized protein n=1 Tax=Phaseolus coccineus TaxID=3886 RepID=A0AAN9NV51_PHACN